MPSICWTSFKLSHSECFVLLMRPPLALYSLRRSLLHCVRHNAGRCTQEMNEVELRRKFDKEVGAPDKELLWKWLKEDHYVSDVCSGGSDWEEFKEEADRLAKRQWQVSGHIKPPGRAARTSVEVELEYYEKECAQTASLYLAKKAASLPEVGRFRQERLGGKLLTTEEAEESLRRELLKDLPDDPHSLSWLDQSLIAEVGVMGLEHLLDFALPIDRWPAVGLSQHLLFPHEGSDGRIVSGKRIAKNYSDLCLYLAAIFPWDPYDAARFLLTGERPEVVPLELSYNRHRRVFTLNFAPWISEKTFRKAYRKCQKAVHGGDNRRMQERTLAVMRFVIKHTDDEGNRLSWPELTNQWNKKHPGEWRFKDRFVMRKTYLRAEEELAG